MRSPAAKGQKNQNKMATAKEVVELNPDEEDAALDMGKMIVKWRK